MKRRTDNILTLRPGAWTLILGVVLLACAPAWSAEADPSSPIAAAKNLFNAISTGDREAVRQGLYAEGESQQALVAAMADLIVSGKQLGDAARARYGKAGDAIGRGMLDPADLERLDRSTVTGTADAALITVPNQTRPMSFRRQDGKWKLVITDFGGADPESIEKQTKLVHDMAEVLATSATELTTGKYPTADEAMMAIQQSLHQVMLTFYRPSTTRSTTQPATAPAEPHP